MCLQPKLARMATDVALFYLSRNQMTKRTTTIQSIEESNAKLAVLIDADNAQAAVIENLLAEIAKFGEATVKRIYGDFTSPTSSSWKKVLQIHAIKPMQQFAYTTGKNATDSTMIIDAMDLLYTRRFDGFCLITSDSDFTGLAMRLREEGLQVYGFGEQKTPEAFRKACHRFILTEVLRPVLEEKSVVEISQKTKNQDDLKLDKKNKDDSKLETMSQDFILEHFLLNALEQSSDETGWAHLGTFGNYVRQIKSDFDSRQYGHKKLSDLVKARADLFKTEERSTEGTSHKNLYLKAAGK
jgi:hypothetical protein